jgi:homoserine kinase
LGCSISGAGPALFALCQEKTQAAEIGAAMKKIYDQHHLESRILTGGINLSGTVLM